MSTERAQRDFARAVMKDMAADDTVFDARLSHGCRPRTSPTHLGIVSDSACVRVASAVIAQSVYGYLSDCLSLETDTLAEGMFLSGGKQILEHWLAAPTNRNLQGALTIQGSTNVLELVSQFGADSGLSPEDSDKIMSRIALRLFWALTQGVDSQSMPAPAGW